MPSKKSYKKRIVKSALEDLPEDLTEDLPTRDVEEFGTIESITELENKAADEEDVEGLERTSQDYEGRGSEETDGAVPTAPPDTDPLRPGLLRTPLGPPKHNM